MADLRPCTGCLRHVRADETRCPFCEAALEVIAPAPLLSEARLGRAARMAFTAAMATAQLAGCGNSSSAPTGAPIAAESSTAAVAAPSEPTTPLPKATPTGAVPSNPFLVTGGPSPANTDTGNSTAPPTDNAKPFPTTPPKITPTGPPK